MYLDDTFRKDVPENLSGVIGHGESFPNLVELSIYGEPRQEVKVLDGVFLAVRSEVLLQTALRFDPQSISTSTIWTFAAKRSHAAYGWVLGRFR